MADISVKDACEQLLAAARDYVEFGSRIGEVIDRPFVALQIDASPTAGTANGVLPTKVSNGLMERLATLRRLTSDFKKKHFQMTEHSVSPCAALSHKGNAESSI